MLVKLLGLHRLISHVVIACRRHHPLGSPMRSSPREVLLAALSSLKLEGSLRRTAQSWRFIFTRPAARQLALYLATHLHTTAFGSLETLLEEGRRLEGRL